MVDSLLNRTGNPFGIVCVDVTLEQTLKTDAK